MLPGVPGESSEGKRVVPDSTQTFCLQEGHTNQQISKLKGNQLPFFIPSSHSSKFKCSKQVLANLAWYQ